MGELQINAPDILNGINSSRVETILLTGFGPFSVHKVNSSWEAVQEIKQMGLGDRYNVVIEKLDVEYDAVDNVVPKLWKKHNPKLVVHCGVSGIAKELTLEKLAHRSGYESKDNAGCIPHSNCCKQQGPDVLETELDLGQLCNTVNSSDIGVAAVISKDPGRYLCDYTYYKSLSINSRCSAFIHVPPLHNPYSAKELASAIRLIILSMLQQLDEENIDNDVQALNLNTVS